MKKIFKYYEDILATMQETVSYFEQYKDIESYEEFEAILHIIEMVKSDINKELVTSTEELEVGRKILELEPIVKRYLKLMVYW